MAVSMTTVSSRHLLQLPTELRLQIYEYVVPAIPLRAPKNEFLGLAQTCQQLRAEVVPIILRAMRNAFAAITQPGLEHCDYKIVIKPARNLHELYHGEIQMVFNFTSPSERTARSCIMMHELLDFAFETCTMKVNCDHFSTDALQGYKIFLSGCLRLFVTEVPYPIRAVFRPKVITFDCTGVSTYAQGRFYGFPRTYIENIYRQERWSLKVHTRKGMWPSIIQLKHATRDHDWTAPQILNPETRDDNIISSYVDPPWRNNTSPGSTAS